MEFVLGGDIWVYQVKETLTYSLGSYHLKDFSRNPSTTKRYLIMKLLSNADSHILENNDSIKQFSCHRAHCISIKLPCAPYNALVPRYTYSNRGFYLRHRTLLMPSQIHDSRFTENSTTLRNPE